MEMVRDGVSTVTLALAVVAVSRTSSQRTVNGLGAAMLSGSPDELLQLTQQAKEARDSCDVRTTQGS